MSQQYTGKSRRSHLSLSQPQPQQQPQTQQQQQNNKPSNGAAKARKASVSNTSDASNAIILSQASAMPDVLPPSVVAVNNDTAAANFTVAKIASTFVGPKSAKEAAVRAAAIAAVAAAKRRSVEEATPTDIIEIDDDEDTKSPTKSGGTPKEKREKSNGSSSAKKPTDATTSDGNTSLKSTPAKTTPVKKTPGEVTLPPKSGILMKTPVKKTPDEAKVAEAVPKSPSQHSNGKKIAAESTTSHTTPTKVASPVKPSTPEVDSGEQSKASNDGNVDTVEDVPMETLQMEVDTKTPTPSPVKSTEPKATDGVVEAAKPPQSPALSFVASLSSRISPFIMRTNRRGDDANNGTAAAANNLSTVSERSNELVDGVSPAATVGEVDKRRLFGSLRHITGRRSTRPLREQTLHNSMRETYRRTRTELDDDYDDDGNGGADDDDANEVSISSMNATAGSVAMGTADGDGSGLGLSVSRKRSGAQLGDSESDLVAASSVTSTAGLESPKRARIDFGGMLYGMMASPVTLLRNKFSRSNLLCSTPNAKVSADGQENAANDEDLAGVLEGDDESDAKQLDGKNDDVGAKLAVESIADTADVEHVDVDEAVVASESIVLDAGEGAAKVGGDIHIVEGQSGLANVSGEAVVTIKLKPKSSCMIM